MRPPGPPWLLEERTEPILSIEELEVVVEPAPRRPVALVPPPMVEASPSFDVDAACQQLALGESLLQAGCPGEALSSFLYAREVLGDTWDVLFALGRCAIAAGDVVAGAGLLVDALHVTDDRRSLRRCYEELARAYGDADDLDEAAYYARRARSLSPPPRRSGVVAADATIPDLRLQA